jgi:Protein of unknown function (DUF2752)
LQRDWVIAIVPPPLSLDKVEPAPLDVLPVMSRWVRGTLVGIALGLSALFAVAAYLNPYRSDGSARRMETHMQLGLPECTFKQVTGLPCPSCGMTTSFALTIRGDFSDAVRANSVGVLLALTLLAAIPWCLVSVLCGRTLFVQSAERALMFIVIGLLSLMLVRWAILVGLRVWFKSDAWF